MGETATYSDFKSNFKVRVKDSDAQLARAEEKIISINPTNEFPGINYLSRTDWEEQAISECFIVFQNIIAQLGLNIRFNYFPEFIHVVEAANFKEQMGQSYCGEIVDGNFCDGHVYAIREIEHWKFIHRLTHEMAHLASYYEVQATLPDNERRLLKVRRIGLAIIIDKERRLFDGFCEGVTEMIAMWARDEFICRNELLTLSDCRELKSKVSYLEHMAVIEKLIRGRGADRFARKALLNSIYQSFFTGDFNFVKNLDLDKEALKILMAMDSSLASAQEAIKKLA